MEVVPGDDQLRRGDGERLGSAEQIGFVVGEEFESAGENCRIAEPGAQRIGIEPGEFKIAPRPVLACENPAERRQRKGLRVLRL